MLVENVLSPDRTNQGKVMDYPLHILLLCDHQPRIAANVGDHIKALTGLSRHHWQALSMLGVIPRSVDLNRFDVIVVHYTLTACSEQYLSAQSRARLARCRALKAIFIQDEYRHVNASVAAMRELDVGVLFTCVPESEIPKVYSEEALPGVRKVSVLTGYVPARLLNRPVPPPSRRLMLVGFRGRRLPYWLGALGQEKYTIGARFLVDGKRFPGLTCDISFREEDRLYGDRWTKFLLQCRAVLGAESGASVFDFTGEVQRTVENAVNLDPSLGFEEISRQYLADAEGRIRLNQVSPRCFEAAALRTTMVMYPGDYSGRLKAWRHYIPLAKDHSNMDEVVAALGDAKLIDDMTERAYREVARARENSYAAFVEEVEGALETAFDPSTMAAAGPAYGCEEIARLARRDLRSFWQRLRRTVHFCIYMLIFRWLFGWMKPSGRERLHRRLKWLRYVVRG